MSNKDKWTEAKRKRAQDFLNQKYSITETARIMKISYDSLRNAIRRYGLKTHPIDKINNEDIFKLEQEGKKIKRVEVDQLSKYIGEKIYKGWEYIPLPEPKFKKPKGKREEISILDISDVHMGMKNSIYDEDSGKRIITYNHDIFVQEMKNLQNSIFQIRSLQENEYYLRKLVIFVLGDIITNDRIFPEQIFEIEKCVGLQVWDAIPIWVQFFNNLLNIYETIEVVCVVGNHGRSNPIHYSEPVENNFEYHVYRSWQKQFERSKRIKIIVPDTGRYIHQVGRWRHLIEHGHELKGYTENAIQKQTKELYINVGGFDVMHFGHLHQLAEKRIADKVIVKQNGCFVKDTPILMGDFTYKNIQEVNIGDELIGFIPAKKGFELVKTKVINTNTRKTMVGDLLFSDGKKLTVTTEHPIYAYHKRTHLDKGWLWKFPYEDIQTLSLDDPKINLRETLPWKVGYISGFLDGDGNFYEKDNRKVIHFYNNEYSLLVWIKNTINKLLGVDEYKGINTISKDKNCYSIQLGKKQLVENLLKLFIKLEDNEYFARGYLAGFFDAEGNYKNKTNSVRVFNTHKKYINKVCNYCKQLDFSYSINTEKRKTGKYKDLTTILISPVHKFFSKCQPFLARKKDLIKFNPCIGKNYKKSNLIKKSSFELIGKTVVYNLETDCHTYIANGIPVHNCWIYKDEYAFKKFKTYSIPEQHFFGCNDKRKETWKYALDLRR